MASETYVSGGADYNITVNPAPSDGKKHPVILLVHGNFGLGPPYGEQIHSFARDLAGLGYLTAVPQYYKDDQPRPTDMVPKDQILADAIAAVTGRADADRSAGSHWVFAWRRHRDDVHRNESARNGQGTRRLFRLPYTSDPRWGVAVSAHNHPPR